MRPELQEMVAARALREGTTKARVLERALGSYFDAPAALSLDLDPAMLGELHNAAARMDQPVARVLEALIRDSLPSLTEDDVDPQTRVLKARARAKELLER